MTAERNNPVMPEEDDSDQESLVETERSFICASCSMRFRRQSHLDRHKQSHLPEEQQRRVNCAECGRSFSRVDVCLRHVRKVHRGTRSDVRKAGAKSCQRCRQRKLRCDRHQPCTSCKTAESQCIYQSGHIMDTGTRQTYPEAYTTYQDSGNGCQLPMDVPDATGQANVEQTDTTGPSDVFHQSAIPFQPASLEVSLDHGNPGRDNEVSAGDILGSIYDTVYDLHPTFYNHIPTIDETMATFWSDYTVSTNDLQMTSRVASSFSDSHTLPQDLYSAETGACSLNPAAQVGSTRHQQPQQCLASLAGHRQISADTYQQSLHSQENVSDTQSNKQEWPFDHTPNSATYRCQLPPLRQVLQSAIKPQSPGNEDTIKCLIQILSVSKLLDLDQYQSLQGSSAVIILRRSTELYISEFHSILPILHIPSFELSTCPTVLLAAIACTGALFSDGKQSLEESRSLSEISSQMITWLGGSDSANNHDPAYVSACIIHQIYSLGSGSPQLYQKADGARGTIFANLRGMELLNSSPSFETEDIESRESRRLLSSGTRELSCEWIRWRDSELNKRITWAAFEYDCSLCTLTGRRGAVDLLELPGRLPCVEALWDAPTAQAWAALMSHLPESSNGVFLPCLLRETLAGNDVPCIVPAWGRRICAQIIGRLLWDLKQLHSLSLSNFLALPILAATHSQTKLVLLNSLMKLRDSMEHPTSTSDIIHLNIASIVCHYSHLYASDEMMDLVVFIFRAGARERAKQSDAELDLAKRRLSSIFANKIGTTRKLVWHAAQIIAMAREYLVHAPCETMRLFMGHIFILAFAKFCPLEQDFGMPNRRHVQLDHPTRNLEQKALVDTWIIHGGPASIGSVLDIQGTRCIEGLKRDALLLMREMRVWKLAEKFCRILESFDTQES